MPLHAISALQGVPLLYPISGSLHWHCTDVERL